MSLKPSCTRWGCGSRGPRNLRRTLRTLARRGGARQPTRGTTLGDTKEVNPLAPKAAPKKAAKKAPVKKAPAKKAAKKK